MTIIVITVHVAIIIILLYLNPISLTVQRRPFLQHEQGLYSVQPQSTMIAAFPLQPENPSITEPTYFGAQLRTMTGQQPVHPQLLHDSA